MKNKFYILIILVFLGLAGQSVISWIFQPKYQTVMVEDEAKKNEKSGELEKDKFFERPVLHSNMPAFNLFALILKINFQSSPFHSLPERPPKQA